MIIVFDSLIIRLMKGCLWLQKSLLQKRGPVLILSLKKKLYDPLLLFNMFHVESDVLVLKRSDLMNNLKRKIVVLIFRLVQRRF